MRDAKITILLVGVILGFLLGSFVAQNSNASSRKAYFYRGIMFFCAFAPSPVDGGLVYSLEECDDMRRQAEEFNWYEQSYKTE